MQLYIQHSYYKIIYTKLYLQLKYSVQQHNVNKEYLLYNSAPDFQESQICETVYTIMEFN